MYVVKAKDNSIIFLTRTRHHEENFRVFFPREDTRDKCYEKILNMEDATEQYNYIYSLEKKDRKDSFICLKEEKTSVKK